MSLAECSDSRSCGQLQTFEAPKAYMPTIQERTFLKTSKDGKNMWLQKDPVLRGCCYLFMTVIGNQQPAQLAEKTKQLQHAVSVPNARAHLAKKN